MSAILGNPIMVGGGARINIDYGASPPDDITKLWVPLAQKPKKTTLDAVVPFGDEIISTDYTYSGSPYSFPACGIINGKLYIVGRNSGTVGTTTPIYAYDLDTKTFTETGASIPFHYYYGASAVVADGQLYLVGGASPTSSALNTVYKYTPATNTVAQIGTITAYVSRCATCLYDNKIYYFGGNSGNYVSTAHGYFDLSTNTATALSTSLYQLNKRGIACSVYGNYIYLFGGNTDSGYYKNIYKYDPATDTVATLTATLANEVAYTPAVRFGQYTYLFAGYNDSTNFKSIQRFDCVSETITTITAELPVAPMYSFAAIDGNVAYVLAPNQRAIYKFVVKSALAQNNILIQYDGFGKSSKAWKAINTKSINLNLYPVSVYAGNTQNYAELKDAYLYDSATSEWTKLDGSSVYLDMLNALNILGVE